MRKTIIATPSRDAIHAETVFDLMALAAADDGWHFPLLKGSLLSNLRSGVAQAALQMDCDLLFIDSDMRFPPDTLTRLRAHKLDIIGANCRQKQPPHSWTARRNGDIVLSTGKRGVEGVDVLGFGVTLIRHEVLAKLPQPWFAMPWDPVLKKHAGEDVHFCKLAREHGFTINIDHDLSQHVRHIGLKEV